MKRAKEKVAGIILAAGASTRMGEPKQLLILGEQTLLDRILVQVFDSDLDRVILVLGYQAQGIMRELKIDLNYPRLKIIENRNYRDGISSSIITGLSAIEDEFDHAMIILADMPRITSNLINHLLHRYLVSSLPLGAIKIKNTRSHPVIFSRRLYHELHQFRGDVGARDLFQKYADQVCLVEPGQGYNDTDIDSPEDYFRFKRSLED